MRKPKKALDIYRLTISTIFIFILAVLSCWLHFTPSSWSNLKSKPIQVNSQPTLRNRGQEETEMCLRWPSLLCWRFFFFAGPPTSLTSWYLFVCSGIFHIPVVQIYTVISAPFLSPHMLTTLRNGFFGSDGFGYFLWTTETSYFWCQLGHKRKCSLKWKLSNSKWWTLQCLYNVLFGTKNSYLCARSSSLMRILRQYWIQNI